MSNKLMMTNVLKVLRVTMEKYTVIFFVLLLWAQAAQTLNMINMWYYAVGDCVTILAIYNRMYENAWKLFSMLCAGKKLNKMANLMFALHYFHVSVFLKVV